MALIDKVEVRKGAVMERTTARGRLADEAVMFPVDVSWVSEELGREALEALREVVVGRRRIVGGAREGQCAAELGSIAARRRSRLQV
jgi:hypothetical protein